MKIINIYDPNIEVTRDNFVEYLDAISKHPEVIDAHNNWEKLDQEWKDLTKSHAPDTEIMLAATKVRIAKEEKDAIFDHISRLAEEAAEKINVIEEYTKDTIGKCKAIADVEELSVAWHETRRKGIGGSSLSELLGFHWKSYAGNMVYMDDEELDEHCLQTAIEKATPVKSVYNPDTGVLYRGHKVEPALIARYAITHNKRVAISKATWQGKDDFQVINLDGIILDKNGKPEGILECKTSSREWTWQHGVPINYRCQVLWYLRALGFKYADVAVKFDTGVFEVYRVYADETIDGTETTYPLEHYIPELMQRWKDIKYLKDNPKELWGESDVLNDELDSIAHLSLGEKLTEKDIDVLLHADCAHYSYTAPYERMDSKFTKPTFASIQKDGNIEDYVSQLAQPIFYDTLELFETSTLYKHDMLDLIVDVDAIIAIDNQTYNDISQYDDMPEEIINASALRRAIDVEPGRKDFTSISEFHEWLKEKSDT